MKLLLSEREKNARLTCSHCVNLKENGFCRYPIVLEWDAMSVRVAKLISFSEDGLTCQLFKEPINKKVKE